MMEDRLPPAGHAVVLVILDGWGYRPEREDNAIALAATPNWSAMLTRWPHALLATSGAAVGLPDGQMGNSEVGHMNLGAGRVVMQDLPRIDKAIATGELARNPALLAFIATLRASGGTAHLMGLLSPGGVHSHQRHITALARLVADGGVPVAVHGFLDGRDTPPASAADDLSRFLAEVGDHPGIRVATIGGRYYGMDRDQRWDRVRLAYAAIAAAQGPRADDPVATVRASYAAGKTDEFVLPTVIGSYAGMKDGDGLLMANFRADRARQMLSALLDPGFAGFERPSVARFAATLGMAPYSEEIDARLGGILFPAEALDHILGEEVAGAGLKQFRVAETEKYAHVTFFLNGGREAPFPGEDRAIVPSAKVATYDLQPEMSAPAVADRLVAAIESRRYGLIVANFANPDMVGHTGKLDAAISAVATIDQCLGRVAAAVERAGARLLITADHGNVEMMRDPVTGQPHTAHTTGPVPIVAVNAGLTALADGCLADVAPTVLALLGLPQPKAMTGRSLVAPTLPRRASA